MGRGLFYLIMLYNYYICFGQIDSAKINYKIKIYSNDSIDYSNSYHAILNKINDLNFELLYSKNREIASFYETNEDVSFDFTDLTLKKRAKIIADLNTDYFVDLRDKKILMEKEWKGSKYIVIGNYNKYQWVITNDTKKINNYLCKKAISKKTFKDRMDNMVTLYITAWFAPELLVTVGLKDYLGLPGLIFELHECTDSNHDIDKEYNKGRTYYVSSFELNPTYDINIKSLDKGNVITEEAYKKMIGEE